MGDHPSGPARVVSPRSPDRDAATVKRCKVLKRVVQVLFQESNEVSMLEFHVSLQVSKHF